MAGQGGEGQVGRLRARGRHSSLERLFGQLFRQTWEAGREPGAWSGLKWEKGALVPALHPGASARDGDGTVTVLASDPSSPSQAAQVLKPFHTPTAEGLIPGIQPTQGGPQWTGRGW